MKVKGSPRTHGRATSPRCSTLDTNQSRVQDTKGKIYIPNNLL